jgi:hypothetical protein
MKPIYNTDIPPELWLKRFNREQLRTIAKQVNIPIGKNDIDTAYNLSTGKTLDGNIRRFPMDLFVSF